MEAENRYRQKPDEKELTYSSLLEYSPVRGNSISWYSIPGNADVLLVSAPSRAVEEILREKAGSITVISVNELQKLAAGKEPRDGGRKKYDLIVQIGLLDSGAEQPEIAWTKCMKYYQSLLKETGRLLLAVPNRLGLKYFAGCQDEVYDAYFAGPEGYTGGETKQALSKKEYEEVLRQAGFLQIEKYYPYPDYLFPSVIYSEEYLPTQGELNDNIRNFDKDRYVLFDEMRVFNSLLKEGLFEEFSNSFLFLCSMRGSCHADQSSEKVLYSKFSMERDEKFQIRTDIIKKADGERVVRKYPLTKTAEKHMANMLENYHRLQEQTAEKDISFCPAEKCGDAVEFTWVKGEVLQHKLQRMLEQGEKEDAEALIHQYMERTRVLFGAETVDVDLIFPNILVDGENWNVIDYEWTFTAQLPEKWILYRAMFYLALQLPGYEITKLPNLLALAGIKEEEAVQFGNWEIEFQEYLRGDTLPIQNMVDLLGNEVIPFAGQKDENQRETERRINLMEKQAKRLFFHLDIVEKKDKKAVLSGWACARTKQKALIPVHITVFDQNGNRVGRAVNRSMRPDVAEVLKGNTDFPCFGFDLSWSIGENKSYILRLSAGKCQQEIALEIGERN